MLVSFYIHRIFPKEFSLSREILLNLIVSWIISCIVDGAYSSSGSGNAQKCVFNMFSGSFCVDILRFGLFMISLHITTARSFSYFPLPYTWIFEDFSKFLFEPKCVRVFLHYIKEKEPERLRTMNKLMKLYVSEFDKPKDSLTTSALSSQASTRLKSIGGYHTPACHSPTRADGRDVASRVQFLELMRRLELSFIRYRRTRSFVALYTRLKRFEDIAEHTSVAW